MHLEVFFMIHYKCEQTKEELQKIIDWLDQDSEKYLTKTEEQKGYAFIRTNNNVTGAVHVCFSNDWIIVREFFYNDTLTLTTLMRFIADKYPAKGIHVRTYSTKVRADLLKIGFLEKVTISSITDHAQLMYIDYNYDNPIPKTDCDCHFTDEPDESLVELTYIKNKKQSKGINTPSLIKKVGISAFDKNTFIGGLSGQLLENSLHISLLAVDKNYRGKSVGYNLMKMAEKIAVDNNILTLDLSTKEYQARTFYESLGYTVIYTRQDYPIGFENYKLIKYK